MNLRIVLTLALAALPALVASAPDEVLLGRDEGYPPPPRPMQTHQQKHIVASFSGMDAILPHCSLAPSPTPAPLRPAAIAQPVTYRYQGRAFTLDDYMDHQRATAVVVVRDGELVAERYNYARTPEMRMLSNSIAKTLTALGIGAAIADGRIRSVDDRAAQYVPELKGTLYGETRIEDLLRMASGAKYVEDYTANDDRTRYNLLARREGVVAAARSITEREAAPGERFNYSGAQTDVLALVLRTATGKGLCEYLGDRIWRPMGAEARATYIINPGDGSEQAQGGFNATARDYARLGMLLANDGQAQGRQVVPRDWVLAMTDAARQPAAFRPGTMENRGNRYFGYGYQVWLLPGPDRQFALLGIYGQAIFVDPKHKLVMVHMAVARDASGDASGSRLGAERMALWRGVLAQTSP
ncbi:serine hydrolase domain-containing protein [Ramlibacter sp.]|uniref:serine hydrolase domain-containing protein n=1 Tax=Ramlibacter sp. TaxID=1917967 RepID=UPI003D0CEFFC